MYCWFVGGPRALLHQGVAQSIFVQRHDLLHVKVESVRRLVLSRDFE